MGPDDWMNNILTIKQPKVIARIKICGGGLTFTITDEMQYEIPTEEQRENLKKTFGIEVELVEERKGKKNVYDVFSDEYIDECEMDLNAPPERYIIC